jgi:hypothetical protein
MINIVIFFTAKAVLEIAFANFWAVLVNTFKIEAWLG